MLFNTLEFLFFFPVIIAAYYALPHRFRWILLLLASYYFYMCWKPEYVVLILASTIIDYFAALKIHNTEKRHIKKLLLTLSLTTNLGLLFFFKYFNFFNDSLRALLNQFNIFYDVPAFEVLLPVGISFYTFQTLSYTIDVYQGRIAPERHFGIFALYVSFFPQLVAGPIERANRLLPQFRKIQSLQYENVRNGCMLILWGLFKKVVIADRLAEYVNTVYNHAGAYSGWHNILATYFFGFQIYCDFSGYSDIAIGAAMVMGYRLMTNFERPYFARSIREFWQRWHISLSTWFRDYVYIPLGGNRVVKWRMYYNLLIVFVVSGLWHGANWTFVVWGFLHGLFLVAERMTQGFRERLKSGLGLSQLPALNNALSMLVTFNLAMLAWVFFRANSLDDAFTILKDSLSITSALNLNLFHYPADFTISIAMIALLLGMDFTHEKFGLARVFYDSPAFVKWMLVIFLISMIYIFGKFEAMDFIYFQF